VRFRPGQKYFLKYKNWHSDPAPYLYVTSYTNEFVCGFNLHYLPNVRFKIPLDRYRRVNEKTWAKAYDNMVQMRMFRTFIELLDKTSEKKMSKATYQSLIKLVSRKHPWAMESYRKYHTSLLGIRIVQNVE
jgi:hypothetical protein